MLMLLAAYCDQLQKLKIKGLKTKVTRVKCSILEKKTIGKNYEVKHLGYKVVT